MAVACSMFSRKVFGPLGFFSMKGINRRKGDAREVDQVVTPPGGAARGWPAPPYGAAAPWSISVFPLDSVFVSGN
jgi:hypothetical protein